MKTTHSLTCDCCGGPATATVDDAFDPAKIEWKCQACPLSGFTQPRGDVRAELMRMHAEAQPVSAAVAGVPAVVDGWKSLGDLPEYTGDIRKDALTEVLVQNQAGRMSVEYLTSVRKLREAAKRDGDDCWYVAWQSLPPSATPSPLPQAEMPRDATEGVRPAVYKPDLADDGRRTKEFLLEVIAAQADPAASTAASAGEAVDLLETLEHVASYFSDSHSPLARDVRAVLAAERARPAAPDYDAIAERLNVPPIKAQLDRAVSGWKRECDSVDEILLGVGLVPDQYRSEGGSLLVQKAINALRTAAPVIAPGEAVADAKKALQTIRNAFSVRGLDFNRSIDLIEAALSPPPSTESDGQDAMYDVIADAMMVLRMVDENTRLADGERGIKAWNGVFVKNEVRRVLDGNVYVTPKTYAAPREPTKEMLDAGNAVSDDRPHDIYVAMYDAAMAQLTARSTGETK